MGNFNRIFRGKATAESNGHSLRGSTALNASTVLGPTDAQAFCPENPGSFRSLRPVPVVSEMRPIEPSEADALQAYAQEWKSRAKSSVAGYRSLESIEKSVAKIHLAYRGYQATVAELELEKKQADVEYGSLLQRQRPQYAALSSRYQVAESKANQRVQATQAKALEAIKGRL